MDTVTASERRVAEHVALLRRQQGVAGVDRWERDQLERWLTQRRERLVAEAVAAAAGEVPDGAYRPVSIGDGSPRAPGFGPAGFEAHAVRRVDAAAADQRAALARRWVVMDDLDVWFRRWSEALAAVPDVRHATVVAERLLHGTEWATLAEALGCDVRTAFRWKDQGLHAMIRWLRVNRRPVAGGSAPRPTPAAILLVTG